MTLWTAPSLRSATGGRWLRRPHSQDEREPVADGVSTDTRALRPGQAFVALRGERFDAHEFLDSAVSAGASLLIIDRPEKTPPELLTGPGAGGPAVLCVPDTRAALGRLAAAYRRTLEGTRVIAVVGSNGKTTTTRLIHAALGARLRGSCSPRSFNNDVGVPLTILAARPGDQYLVCEVGSNHPGETVRLARIVQPDIAVITGVGRDHMEFFGTLQSVAQEHASILPDLRPHGVAVVPFGEALLTDHLRPVPSVVTFGTDSGADLRLTGLEHEPDDRAGFTLRFRVNDRSEFTLPIAGEHNALNALAAIAVARRLGLDEPTIARGLAAAAPAEMRSEWRCIAGATVCIDCYNANPDSMEAALRAFEALSRDRARRVLILGEMLDMGPHAPAAHSALGERLARAEPPPDLLVLVGGAMAHAAAAYEAARPGAPLHFLAEMDDACATRIASLIRPGDAVLLKASRAVRLERIVHALERTGAAAGAPATMATAGESPPP